MRKWEDLPEQMQNDAVKPYYDYLSRRRFQLYLKRLLDIFISSILIILLSPIMLIVSIAIVFQSGRPVFFRQTRITQYGREFDILKFRTMVVNAETIGPQITANDDNRVTLVGKFVRKLRIDEIPQLFNVLIGSMSFVGTRPEVPRYVAGYSNEMMATLLLPAGITSEASILFKDEGRLLSDSDNPDETYMKRILPEKMRINLRALQDVGLYSDISTMLRTLLAVTGKTVSPRWQLSDIRIDNYFEHEIVNGTGGFRDDC